MYLESQLQQDKLWFMHFKLKTPENGGKNILEEEQITNKRPLMFLDVKVPTER